MHSDSYPKGFSTASLAPTACSNSANDQISGITASKLDMKPYSVGDLRCGRYAKDSHHHRDCREEVKCVCCGGPHESFSRNYPRLYPTRYE